MVISDRMRISEHQRGHDLLSSSASSTREVDPVEEAPGESSER